MKGGDFVDTKKAIIPSQYIARWTTEDGVRLNIFFYVDLEDWSLNKVFVDQKTFDLLNLKKIIKQSTGEKYILKFETNDATGYDVLVAIDKLPE